LSVGVTWTRERAGYKFCLMNATDESQRWRARADEAHVLAEEMTTAEGRGAMLEIARNCELMAERAERFAARKPTDGAAKAGRGTD